MPLPSDKFKSLRLPMSQGVLPISGAQVPAEIIAGITLDALAVPEVMGCTKISDTPVITGLYTILIPMALFALFGCSRHLVVGADSATAAILATGLVGLAATGSDGYVALAAFLALMAAALLILARLIGLGFMVDFLSRTVLIGFLTGVGIQVGLGEIFGIMGLKGGGHGTLQKIWNDLQQLEQVNFAALGIALSVLVVIIGSKKVSKKIPGKLIAVIRAIVVSRALNLKAHVHILGETLYRKIHHALETGGRIVIRDHVMSPDHTQPLEGALFAVNMLAGTSGGGTYTFEEIKAGLAAAGFSKIRQIKSKGMFSLVEGFKV